MSTVVRAKVPADEFVLGETFEQLPDAEVETERAVKQGSAGMPLLWVRNVDPHAFEGRCDDDPSVDGVELMERSGEELLYWMDWTDRIDAVLGMLTTGEGTILRARGFRDVWELKVLHPSHDGLGRMEAACADHELSFSVEAVYQMEGRPASRFGLTDQQREALTRAVAEGYFAVPRETTLEDLAADMAISHQALSERLRRATETLVSDAL